MSLPATWKVHADGSLLSFNICASFCSPVFQMRSSLGVILGACVNRAFICANGKLALKRFLPPTGTAFFRSMEGLLKITTICLFSRMRRRSRFESFLVVFF